mmetsp:Transcript_4881/g.16075  ORF Transcript_4881/g.16075 Transcript_4881/m.16075 type:complete len:406 (-) Transcript_4881:9-1226(-)
MRIPRRSFGAVRSTRSSHTTWVLHLAMSLQRAGGVLNVLGARDDVRPVPAEFQIDDNFRKDINFKFSYADKDGNTHKELGYRRILFKRLLFLWRLARSLPPNDLLMYVDGDDVLFQRPLDDVVATWKDMVSDSPHWQEPVIFMGLPGCSGRFSGDHASVRYPLKNSKKGLLGAAACARWRIAQHRGTLPFLDSGGYLGRAHRVKEVLEDAMEFARLGLDYICMSTLTVTGIRLGPSKLRIDTEARLFWSVRPLQSSNWGNWTPEATRPFCGPGYFDSEGRPAAFAPTGQTPAVLHFVGPSKWYWLKDCMDSLRQQRRLEWEAGGGDGPASRAVASFCSFQFGAACPGAECTPLPGLPQAQDCACFTCDNAHGNFLYYDLDREQYMTFDLQAFLDLADQGVDFKLE